MMARQVWLEGALVPAAEAAIPIDDLGFLYGAACFETMRVYGGVVFRLEEHLDRLDRGLDGMGVHAPAREGLRQAIDATLDANGLREARVRLTVSAGSARGRPDLTQTDGPRVLVVAEPASEPPPPARLIVASTRLDSDRPLRESKNANFLPWLLALAEARRAGADEALLLNHAGGIAEAATANCFAVVAGTLVTPPLEAGPLPGVTRAVVLECAETAGIPVEERALTLADLNAADELLLTNSVWEVRPVAEVREHWTADTVPGPVTRLLGRAYRETVSSECLGS